MKKFLTTIFLLLILSSVSFAASSEDVRENLYVRQDVFDAKMEAFMKGIHGEFQVINTKLSALEKRIDDLQATTTSRIDDLKTIIYWGLSILGLLIAFAIFGPSFGEFLRNLRQPAITLEDVKRLIAEAKLSGVPQV